jgi:menaquinone-dependent protoporphyrinogen IX oxidase
MPAKLNIQRLIDDLGGASAVAQIAGVVRTAPYGWINRAYVSSVVLERIKSQKPELDLDLYFEEDDYDHDKTRRGT